MKGSRSANSQQNSTWSSQSLKKRKNISNQDFQSMLSFSQKIRLCVAWLGNKISRTSLKLPNWARCRQKLAQSSGGFCDGSRIFPFFSYFKTFKLADCSKHFFQENEWEVLEWPEYSPDLSWILLKIYGRLWSSDYENKQFFWENLEEKVCEIWNEIDADVVRNLYENYTNRLLDVKKAKGVMTRY